MSVAQTPGYIPQLLPHNKIYTIQVGCKAFQISGLLLSSDGPSYFTNYFQAKDFQPLFIDRNPHVFEIVYKHLQGYAFQLSSDCDFTDLWLDSFYFGLPRLQGILRKEAFHARVGGEWVRLPRKLLEKNTPNFFLVSYETLFECQETLVDRRLSMRPPSQLATTIEVRLPLLLRDLLEVLRGNTNVISNDHHRALLIKECRYYRFLELEQRLIKFSVVQVNGHEEILINLGDLKKKGLRVGEIIQYARPLTSEPYRNMLVQIEVGQAEVKLEAFTKVKFMGRTRELLRLILKDALRGTNEDELELAVLNVGKGTIDGCQHSMVETEATKSRRLDGLDSSIVLRKSILRFYSETSYAGNVSCDLVLFEGVSNFTTEYKFLD